LEGVELHATVPSVASSVHVSAKRTATERSAPRTLRWLDLHDTAWMRFVESDPAADPFHHPAWATMLSDCYGYPAFALALTDERREVLAGMPVMEIKRPVGSHRWVSLPFTDCCVPLTPDTLKAELIAGCTEAAQNAGAARLEVHARLDVPSAQTRVVGVTHTLQLDRDPEAVRRTFSKSQVQRNIKRAEREPISLRRARSRSDVVDAFYGLHLRTRRRQGSPVQPRRFFDLLAERILKPGLGFLLLAYSGATPVAGAVFLTWNRTVTYKYGASDPDYLKHRPNHLIFWEAVRWACENGYETFDFGRSDIDNRGLREFKDGWGTREEPLAYTGIGGAPRGLPSQHVQRVMAGVIRRSPPSVCRALGTLLYRFAA
jgi:CelD/BcsL family acetyltransferase involved in cellulose biosynthesis